MKRVVLDTNAYTRLMSENGSKTVVEVLKNVERIYICSIVLGELCAGFKLGTKEEKNRTTLKRFISEPPVRLLQTTEETAECYASIYKNLKQAGTPIPTNDLWIAAHTFEAGAALLTYDKHFDLVPGLRLVAPQK